MSQIPFRLGDRVIFPSFTDCFGKRVPLQDGLTVTCLRFIPALGEYWQVSTEGMHRYVEGAERFLEHESKESPD